MALYGHKQKAYGLESTFLPNSDISSPPKAHPRYSCNWQTASVAGGVLVLAKLSVTSQ